MRTPMLHRCFEEEVVSRRKNARPSRRQKHDTLQCMFLRSAKQGGRHWYLEHVPAGSNSFTGRNRVLWKASNQLRDQFLLKASRSAQG
jgi:hypothetical protein